MWRASASSVHKFPSLMIWVKMREPGNPGINPAGDTFSFSSVAVTISEISTMNNITGWWSKIGLQLKLQLLIQGFLIVVLVGAQQWLSNQFEQRALRAAEDRTVAVADGVINGLNTLMVTKLGDKDVISDPVSRALFIEKMGVSDNLKELRVVRGEGTNDEFGVGLPQEQPVDDMDRSVLASGKTQFKMTANGGEASLRAVLPFMA